MRKSIPKLLMCALVVGAVGIPAYAATSIEMEESNHELHFVGRDKGSAHTHLGTCGFKVCSSSKSEADDWTGFRTLPSNNVEDIDSTPRVFTPTAGQGVSGNLTAADPPVGSVVPEPGSLVLFGTGLLLLGGTLRRRNIAI